MNDIALAIAVVSAMGKTLDICGEDANVEELAAAVVEDAGRPLDLAEGEAIAEVPSGRAGAGWSPRWGGWLAADLLHVR